MSAPSSEEGLNALDNVIAENEKRGDWGALALFGEAFPTLLSTVNDVLEHFGVKASERKESFE
jgi:hypothetical protein